MKKPEILITAQGRKIAYHKTDGEGHGVVFLGGFSSDMDGTKAVHLENWARKLRRAFIRFDCANARNYGACQGIQYLGAGRCRSGSRCEY